MMARYSYFQEPTHSIVPRLDAVRATERLAPDEPLVAAYLGGRPVVLARTDPRRTGRQVTLPVTISRLRRAIDLERGRGDRQFEPSLVDDWPLTHMPIGATEADVYKLTGVGGKSSLLSVVLFLGIAAGGLWILTRG